MRERDRERERERASERERESVRARARARERARASEQKREREGERPHKLDHSRDGENRKGEGVTLIHRRGFGSVGLGDAHIPLLSLVRDLGVCKCNKNKIIEDST